MTTGAFASRPFQIRDVIRLVTQDVEDNTSTVDWEYWIDKLSYSPTASGGQAHRWMRINGQYVHEYYGNGFNFVNGSNFLIASGRTVIPHNADGTKSFVVEAAADFDILNTAGFTSAPIALPTIPRASKPTIDDGNSIFAGDTVTVRTNRSSSSFTHSIRIIFGNVNTVIASGINTVYNWTPPMSYLNQMTDATSKTGTLRLITYQGSTQIGYKDITFTLKAPADVKPTYTGITFGEGVPAVESAVGKFVQGVSKVQFAFSGAAGVYGSTIARKWMSIGGIAQNSAPSTGASGSGITPNPIAASGSVLLQFRVSDTRGRAAAFDTNIDVLPYAPPAVTAFQVRRSFSDGTVNEEEGTALRVDLTALVASLVNVSQRNGMVIRAYTRPRGSNTWTLSRTLSPVGVTYNSFFVITGSFAVTTAWDVRIEISDLFNTYPVQTSISVASVFMHWGAGLGVGKFHEQGMIDTSGRIFAQNAMVEPVANIALTARSTAPAGWLLCDGSAVSRTTYADLFAAIGTTYGSGDGVNTFNIPNVKGRTMVGRDAGQTEFDTLGKTGGTKAVTLTTAQLPAHRHDMASLTLTASNGGPGGGPGDTSNNGGGSLAAGLAVGRYNRSMTVAGGFTALEGGGDPHTNLPPLIVFNVIIKF